MGRKKHQDEGPKTIRATVRAWVESHAFDNFILALIGFNCVFLALDDVYANDVRKRVLEVAERVFTALFTIEAVVKIGANGFLTPKTGYFRNGWNYLDFTCVVSGYSFAIGASNEAAALRSIRVLRTLRELTTYPGIRLLVVTLIKSMPLLLDVAVLFLWMFFVFGITGMQLFMGKLHARCHEVDSDGVVSPEVSPEWEEQVCATSGAGYKCPPGLECVRDHPNPGDGFVNFDNFAYAVVNIMITLTMSGWTTDNLYYVQDGVGAIAVSYYLLLIIFGSFFALQLMTAIISAKFSQWHDITSKTSILKVSPKSGKGSIKSRVLQFLGLTVEDVPLPAWRQKFATVVYSKYFNGFITGCIAINTCTLAVQYHGMPTGFRDFLEVLNRVLTYIFTMEFVLLHIGQGPAKYWTTPLNVLDGIIVITSIAEEALGGSSSGLSALRAFRVMRVLRSFRMLRKSEKLRRLASTVIKSLLGMGDFLLLLCLFTFIFSLIGMKLFGGMAEFDRENTDLYRKNFNTLGSSMLTNFEMLTGSSWPNIMWTAWAGKGPWVCVFFILWVVLSNFIFLTLLLAVLVTNFQLHMDSYGTGDVEDRQEAEYRERLQRKIVHRVAVLTKNAMKTSLEADTHRLKWWLLNKCDIAYGIPDTSMYSMPFDEFERVYDMTCSSAKATGSVLGALKGKKAFLKNLKSPSKQKAPGGSSMQGLMSASEEKDQGQGLGPPGGKQDHRDQEKGAGPQGPGLVAQDVGREGSDGVAPDAGKEGTQEGPEADSKGKVESHRPVPPFIAKVQLEKSQSRSAEVERGPPTVGPGNLPPPLHPDGAASADIHDSASSAMHRKNEDTGPKAVNRQDSNGKAHPSPAEDEAPTTEDKAPAVPAAAGENPPSSSVSYTKQPVQDSSPGPEMGQSSSMEWNHTIFTQPNQQLSIQVKVQSGPGQGVGLSRPPLNASMITTSTMDIQEMEEYKEPEHSINFKQNPRPFTQFTSNFPMAMRMSSFNTVVPTPPEAATPPAPPDAPAPTGPDPSSNGNHASRTSPSESSPPPPPSAPHAATTAPSPTPVASPGPAGAHPSNLLRASGAAIARPSGRATLPPLARTSATSLPQVPPDQASTQEQASPPPASTATTGPPPNVGPPEFGSPHTLLNGLYTLGYPSRTGYGGYDPPVQSGGAVTESVVVEAPRPAGFVAARRQAWSYIVGAFRANAAAGTAGAACGSVELGTARGARKAGPVCEHKVKHMDVDIDMDADWIKAIPKVAYLDMSEVQIIEEERKAQKTKEAEALAALREKHKQRIAARHEDAKKETSTNERTYVNYRALYCLTVDNPLRKVSIRTVQHPWFDWIILLLIVISSIFLAIDHPGVGEDSKLGQFLKTADVVFTVIFTVEMVAKILAMGLVVHPYAYLRSPANVLDGVIVVTAIVSQFLNSSALTVMRSLRLLRTLRPLRMVSRFKGMQIVIMCLVYSMPSVMNVVMFGLFEFGVFGVLGVQLFAGKFYSCSDPTVTFRHECVGEVELEDGSMEERQWTNAFLNFDNLAEAVKTLFVVATLDDWMEVTYSCIDATEVDQQPKEDNSPLMAMYIILFVLVGNFFWMNLLIGVIIDQYNCLMEEMGPDAMIAPEQVRWMAYLQMKAAEQRTGADEPNNKFRAWFYHLSINKWFEYTIMGCIVANVLFMASDSYTISPLWKDVLYNANIVFLMVFLGEAVVKIIGFGPRGYIKDDWNKLDLFIVVASTPELFVKVGFGATLFRIFRVSRMFRIVQSANGLRALFNTLLQSLPAVGNVGSLLFLLMFVYSVMAMNLYGDLEMDHHANFHNFGISMMTLFRMCTGDAWAEILFVTQECDRATGCKPSVVPSLFFISFVVFGSMVMLNLIIAIVLDKFVAEATSEGLLSSDDVFQVLRKKLIFDRFLARLVRMAREVKTLIVEEDQPGEQATEDTAKAKATRKSKRNSIAGSTFRMLMGKDKEEDKPRDVEDKTRTSLDELRERLSFSGKREAKEEDKPKELEAKSVLR